MSNYIKKIFEDLNKSNIRYAVLRDYEMLPYKVNHDLDIAVNKKDLNKMIETIEKVSNEFNYRQVHMSKRKDFTQLYFYKKDKCIKFDIWSGFTYKGLTYLEIEAILQKTKTYRNIKVLDENTELLVSFLKEFLHNEKIREDKIDILNMKLINNNTFYTQSLKFVNKSDLKDFANYLLQRKTFLSSEAKKYKKRLFFENIRNYGAKKTIASVFSYITKYIIDKYEKKGIFIVLIGPDGSGKTTLSKMFLDEIKSRKSCFSNSYYIHGRFGFIPNLSGIIGKKEDTRKFSFELEKEKKSYTKHSRFKTTLYMSYYLIDYLVGAFVLYKLKFTNSLIIADRYFYDYFYQNSFSNYSNILKYIYKKIAPKPDYFIYLKAEPHLIYKRKPELSKEIIKYQQNEIEKLLEESKFYKNMLIVRTDIDPRNTYYLIMEKILS